MQPFQERVIDEQMDLDMKINRLREFISGETFPGLPEREQDRLREQLHYMLGYNTVLTQRIEAFQ